MDPVPACAAAAGGAAPPPAPDPAADPSDALSRACRAAGGADVPAAQWDRALRGLCAEPGAQDSNLSAIGDPVEFQALWTAAGAEQIRATLDPVPGASGAERRARAVAAVPGLSPGQRALRAAVTAAQQAQGARFGGWIGLRPGNPGPAAQALSGTARGARDAGSAALCPADPPPAGRPRLCPGAARA
ncbi:hypothetical protein ACTTAF_04935 [Rhodobacter capsulatus]|uniref:hypothetical protein n=1 Tax=Rhodobacter capsulatus TaxID=1061 RepID=UPI0040387EDF